MSDATNQTSRFAFQKIGTAQLIEPKDYNANLDAIDAQLSEVNHVATDFTLGTGVAMTYERPTGLRRLRLTLTNVLLTLAGATTSCVASEALVTFPATSNIILVGARCNLTGVKDGTTLLAADTPAFGIGTVAASASTLATTTQNLCNSANMAGTLSAAMQNNTGAATGLPLYVAKGASNQIFLNLGIASKAGGTLTVNGTVEIFYFENGNFSSVTA